MYVDNVDSGKLLKNLVDGVAAQTNTWLNEALDERRKAKKLLHAWLNWAKTANLAEGEDFMMYRTVNGDLFELTKEFLEKS